MNTFKINYFFSHPNELSYQTKKNILSYLKQEHMVERNFFYNDLSFDEIKEFVQLFQKNKAYPILNSIFNLPSHINDLIKNEAYSKTIFQDVSHLNLYSQPENWHDVDFIFSEIFKIKNTHNNSFFTTSITASTVQEINHLFSLLPSDILLSKEFADKFFQQQKFISNSFLQSLFEKSFHYNPYIIPILEKNIIKDISNFDFFSQKFEENQDIERILFKNEKPDFEMFQTYHFLNKIFEFLINHQVSINNSGITPYTRLPPFNLSLSLDNIISSLTNKQPQHHDVTIEKEHELFEKFINFFNKNHSHFSQIAVFNNLNNPLIYKLKENDELSHTIISYLNPSQYSEEFSHNLFKSMFSFFSNPILNKEFFHTDDVNRFFDQNPDVFFQLCLKSPQSLDFLKPKIKDLKHHFVQFFEKIHKQELAEKLAPVVKILAETNYFEEKFFIQMINHDPYCFDKLPKNLKNNKNILMSYMLSLNDKYDLSKIPHDIFYQLSHDDLRKILKKNIEFFKHDKCPIHVLFDEACLFFAYHKIYSHRATNFVDDIMKTFVTNKIKNDSDNILKIFSHQINIHIPLDDLKNRSGVFNDIKDFLQKKLDKAILFDTEKENVKLLFNEFGYTNYHNYFFKNSQFLKEMSIFTSLEPHLFYDSQYFQAFLDKNTKIDLITHIPNECFSHKDNLFYFLKFIDNHGSHPILLKKLPVNVLKAIKDFNIQQGSFFESISSLVNQQLIITHISLNHEPKRKHKL